MNNIYLFFFFYLDSTSEVENVQKPKKSTFSNESYITLSSDSDSKLKKMKNSKNQRKGKV